MELRRQRGGAVVELAFASLGLAFFIVGATDLARIFQARSAVQAAVQEGLRCVYPLDASCGAVMPNPPAPILFDVWVNRRSPAYAIQQEYFTASAQWNTEQRWNVQREATVVQSITMDQPQRSYVQQEVLYPVDAHAVYIVQTRDLPRVGGADPLSPVFRDRSTGAEAMPNTVISLQSIRDSTQLTPQSTNGIVPDDAYYRPEHKIGEVSLSLREAWRGRESLRSALALLARRNASLRCYQSPVVNRGGRSFVQWGAAGEPELCRYRSDPARSIFDGTTLKVPLMFHVSGSIAGTVAAQSTPGKLVMLLQWSSPTEGEGSLRLGGRLISDGGRGSLVVRGAAWEDLRRRAQTAHSNSGYADEINTHQTLGPLPIDAQVTLSFFLSSANGQTVAWQGGELRLFFPTFELVKQTFPCGYSKDPTQCATPPKGVAVSYSAASTSSPLKLERRIQSACRVEQPTPFEASPSAVLEQVSSFIANDITPPQRTFWTLASNAAACADRSTRYSCPNSSKREALQGCKVEEWSRDDLLRECPLPKSLPKDAKLRVEYKRYPLKDQYMKSGECSGPEIPSCAVRHRKDAGRAVLTESPPSCRSQVVSTPAESFGPFMKNSCDDPDYASQIARYRAKYDVPVSARILTGIKPGPDLITEVKPTESCLLVKDTEVVKETQCGSKVASAVVEACCREANNNCRYTQASSGRNGGSDSLQIAFNQAIGRTVETVQAALPAANYSQSCAGNDPYCLQVSGDLIDNNARVRMSAQVHVPFQLLKAVGWQGTTVSYEEARVLERSRLRDGDFVN